MPKTWDATLEQVLLILVSAEADVKPSSDLWAKVADRLGGGLSASAVSYAPKLSVSPYLLLHMMIAFAASLEPC